MDEESDNDDRVSDCDRDLCDEGDRERDRERDRDCDADIDDSPGDSSVILLWTSILGLTTIESNSLLAT